MRVEPVTAVVVGAASVTAHNPLAGRVAFMYVDQPGIPCFVYAEEFTHSGAGGKAL